MICWFIAYLFVTEKQRETNKEKKNNKNKKNLFWVFTNHIPKDFVKKQYDQQKITWIVFHVEDSKPLANG